MKRLLYTILIIVAFASCKTTSRSVKTDQEITNVTNYDSIFERFLQIEAGRITEIQKSVHDSVVTNVTIYRYDTIIVNGEPIIKEKIVVEQVKISGENTIEHDQDSIQATEVVFTETMNNDSIKMETHELRQNRQMQRYDIISVLLLVLVVILAYICIEQYKGKASDT